MLKLSWRRAAAWRVSRHQLDRRAHARDFLQVASRLCGLHAQLMSSAELTLWARTDSLDRQAVQRALWEDRSLVKTWAMRGTLHLLPASEFSLWSAALGASRRYAKEERWKKYFGITLEELDRLSAAIATALEGRILTREDLVSHVQRLTGSAALATQVAENSWGTILKPAAFSGRLCFAPGIGQRLQWCLRANRPSKRRKGHHATLPFRLRSGYGSRPGALVAGRRRLARPPMDRRAG
jgi:Winged helix DNA-binding domain